MFKKGHNIGRPKGSKDKSYLTLQYWYNELMKDWDKLSPSQRTKISVQLMQMLTNKMKALPGTPEQSVLNAKDTQALLEELSNGEEVKKNVEVVTPSLPLPTESVVLPTDDVNVKGNEI